MAQRRKKKKPKNVLERKNGSWYENGVKLSYQDYIFHSNAYEGTYVLSGRTGEKYRIGGTK